MNGLLKLKAINLRRRGLSYSEILQKIPVAKSTLSLWLRTVGLSKRQKQRLTNKKLAAMRRGWLTAHQNKLIRTKKIKDAAKREVVNLIRDHFWLLGITLYWAEGSKEKSWTKDAKVTFSNMDINMHKLFLRWLKKYVRVNNEDIGYELYIHKTADITKAKQFWMNNLNLTPDRLRVYFKKNKLRAKRNNTSADYFGLLRIVVRKSSGINRRFAGWIDGIIIYSKHHWGIV